MSALPKTKLTVAEHLVFERASPNRHEFVDGEIYLVTDGSFSYARIAGLVEIYEGIDFAVPSETEIALNKLPSTPLA